VATRGRREAGRKDHRLLRWQGRDLSIGRLANRAVPANNDFPFHGTIDEVRISKVARYLGDFTPSRSRFAPDANTIALYHFDEISGRDLIDAAGHHNGELAAGAGAPSRVAAPCLSAR